MLLRWPWFELPSELWNIFSLILGGFYLIFYVVIVTQLCLLLFYRHKFPSYHSAVLILGMVLSGLRVLYFGKRFFFPLTEEWINILEEILCWIPLNFQYAMLHVLFLYYCKIILFRAWKEKLKKFFFVSIFLNVFYLVLTIAWMGVTGDTIAGEEIIVKVRYMLIIIPDLIIIVCLIVFTYILTKISSLHESRNFSGRNYGKRSKILNAVLMIGFLYRTLSYLFFYLYLFTPTFEDVEGLNRKIFDFIRFSIFILAEIVPVIAILFFLKQVPGASSGTTFSRPSRLSSTSKFKSDSGNTYQPINYPYGSSPAGNSSWSPSPSSYLDYGQ